MLKNNDFKGWYFKCSNQEQTIAFIPSYHCNNRMETASLQVITDDSAFHISYKAILYRESPLFCQIGNCIFSENGIKLDVQTNTFSANGILKFCNLLPLRYDIMGPFRFVPFMQCRHSVYSMRHRIDGKINVNGKPYIFRNGTGYLEGDSGCSFPKRYIWTHCFFKGGSIMLSIADIPMLGFCFTGIIGVIMRNGKEYRIATYLGARVEEINTDCVTVKQGDFQIIAKRMEKNSQPLFAPNHGQMSRIIHESASCKAYYRFSYQGKVLCEFVGERASFEFEYEL